MFRILFPLLVSSVASAAPSILVAADVGDLRGALITPAPEAMNGMPVVRSRAYRDSHHQWWLEHRASDGEACALLRLSLLRDARGGLWVDLATSTTETCSSVDCDSCSFADTGGCLCDVADHGDGVSPCEHAIADVGLGKADLAWLLP